MDGHYVLIKPFGEPQKNAYRASKDGQKFVLRTDLKDGKVDLDKVAAQIASELALHPDSVRKVMQVTSFDADTETDSKRLADDFLRDNSKDWEDVVSVD